MSKLKLESSKHPYFCSETNYLSNKYTCNYNSWKDFCSEIGFSGTSCDFDMDYNYIFRYDMEETVNDNYKIIGYNLKLFVIQQRRGLFVSHTIKNIKEDDLIEIEKFLKKCWEYTKELWKPISNEYDNE